MTSTYKYRLYVIFIALTAPVLFLFSYMYNPDSYFDDLKQMYLKVVPALKRGRRSDDIEIQS